MIFYPYKLLLLASTLFGVPVKLIKSNDRTRYLVMVRQFIAYTARSYKTGDDRHVFTFEYIGKIMKLHHTTIVNLVEQHENNMKSHYYSTMYGLYMEFLESKIEN